MNKTYLLAAILVAGMAILQFSNYKKVSRLRTKLSTLELRADSLAHHVDSIQNKADSLYGELFPTQIVLGRYEVAFQLFSERNPKAAEQYATIISEETE